MANYNLTSQQLKDTYEQLVQVSGSALVNGIGSLVNAFDYPSNSAFNSFSSSVNTQIQALEAGSGSADWALITNKPAGLVSGSSQVNLSLAFGTASKAISSSYATNASTADFTVFADAANESTLVNVLSTSTNQNFPVTFASSNGNQQIRIDATFGDFFYNPSTNRLSLSNLTVANAIVGTVETASFALTAISATTATSATSASRATSAASADTATSASFATNSNNLDGLDSTAFAQLALNNNFSGTQNFVNIAVSGTGSFEYIESITGSAKIIGDAFIILNAATPAARYAGLVVYDTGSVPATASIEWDGLTDNWIIQEETGNTAVILTGPTASRGTEVLPTVNRLQKGGGHHQLLDSNITDNGTLVSVSTPFTATQITASTGFKGNLDGNATTSTSASRATSAASADSATIATSASFATTATSASRAISAASADFATTSTSASYATFALSADTATTATTATSASFATSASIATFATTAGSATTATSASFATTSSFAAGNFEVSGQMFSPVFSGSIASSTSSIDFNNGNFCVLTLTGATHIGNPSNIKSGTTYTLIINSGSLAASYGTSFKFAGGTAPTLSNGVDIVTMVSDGNRLFATGLADFS
jgi:hypothetical protein